MKPLIFLLCLLFSITLVNAQQYHQPEQMFRSFSRNTNHNYNKNKPSGFTLQTNTFQDQKSLTIIDMGTARNPYSYGYAGGQRSFLCYNKNINVITHFHRMGGTMDPGGYSGDLGYDISVDGGNTFNPMNECYIGTSFINYCTDPARHPNHGIYNPPGNTNPNNAYVAYFAPILSGCNGPWGGYGYGVSKLSTPQQCTQTVISTDPDNGIFRLIPDGFCVNNLGEAWSSDISKDCTTNWDSCIYTNYLLLNHGVWDGQEEDLIYEDILIEALVTDELGEPVYTKIEFAPDGQSGYLLMLADNGNLSFSQGTIYPIVWKTTNGGETWTDPIEVQMGGPDGIDAIKYYLTEQQWQNFWQEPYPDRDEVKYSCAFDCDLSVDMNGNPHIAVGVGIADVDSSYALYTSYPYYAIADIWSPDGGETWDAYIIDRPVTFRSTFDEIFYEDSRTQIARDYTGEHIFIGFMDTNTGEVGNNHPDIMVRGIEVATGHMTFADSAGVLLNKATNVTAGSQAEAQAYWFAMANEVIPGETEMTIPLSYQEMNIEDVTEPVQYKYIQNFCVGYNEFLISAIEENIINQDFIVSQNIPNPFKDITTISISLPLESDITIKIYDMKGCLIQSQRYEMAHKGNQTFLINRNGIKPGIYTYSVESCLGVINKKMIIQ